jgi:hypothetical protein
VSERCSGRTFFCSAAIGHLFSDAPSESRGVSLNVGGWAVARLTGSRRGVCRHVTGESFTAMVAAGVWPDVGEGFPLRRSAVVGEPHLGSDWHSLGKGDQRRLRRYWGPTGRRSPRDVVHRSGGRRFGRNRSRTDRLPGCEAGCLRATRHP